VAVPSEPGHFPTTWSPRPNRSHDARRWLGLSALPGAAAGCCNEPVYPRFVRAGRPASMALGGTPFGDPDRPARRSDDAGTFRRLAGRCAVTPTGGACAGPRLWQQLPTVSRLSGFDGSVTTTSRLSSRDPTRRSSPAPGECRLERRASTRPGAEQ